MPGMDAIALLENLGVKVSMAGKVDTIASGQDIIKNTTITLELL
jgi:cell division protein FtsI (penicillin-binding protein 3)